MDKTWALQDPGLALCRLLTDLLQIGVVLVDDAERCRFASARACELLDAADEAAVAGQWAALHPQLGFRESPVTDAPDHRIVDVTTSGGVRRLRLEVRALPGAPAAGFAVLLRDRAAIGEADRLPMLACRAEASRAVLSGLLHGASGPLNNFNLTLAVLDAAVERFDAWPEAAGATARLRHHLAGLRTEAGKLARNLDELRALADRRPRYPARIDVVQCVRDVARWLRHEAAVREARIEISEPMRPAWVVAEHEALTLALVALASRLLDTCTAGSVLLLSAGDANGQRCTVRIAVAPATVEAALADELFAILPNPLDPGPATARMIVEAHGGAVTVERAVGQFAVVATLPAA